VTLRARSRSTTPLLRAALAAAMALTLGACAGGIDTKPDKPFSTTNVCTDSAVPNGWIRTNDWRAKGCGVEENEVQAKKTASAKKTVGDKKTADDKKTGVQKASMKVASAKAADPSADNNNWMTITEVDRVRVGRVAVLRRRDEQQRARGDEPGDVVEVGDAHDPRDRRGRFDRRAVRDAAAVGAGRAAHGGEADALVEGGMEQRRRAAHRMPGDAHSVCIDGRMGGERGQGGRGVAEDGRHQQPAGDEAVAHLVEVPVAVVLTARIGPGAARAAVLEAGRVGREDDDAAPGEGGAERLQRVAGEPRDLALADVPLTVVLVVHDDRGQRSAGAAGHEEERGDVALGPTEHDALLDVAVALGMRDDAELRRRLRGREIEQGGEVRAQIVERHVA